MKIEIHIDETEISDILDTLKEQGVDYTRDDIQDAMEDYIMGAVMDSKSERMDAIVDFLLVHSE
jgi:cbb3-type cytochrome oxidase cytochrome c subunit